jgi:SAM-dependent methyltransferase
MSVAFKRRMQKWLWPLMPSWPDEGRRIVQGPPLRALLERAAKESHHFRCVFNAGSGEGGYSPLLLELPGVQRVIESDFGWRSQQPPQIDPRQVFFCASLVSIPVSDQTANLVLCTEVLEHIPEHEQALDEITRVTTTGGWLLITVPTPPAPPDANHVREGYRPEELEAMLQHRGFEVIETRFCMRYFFRFLLAHWWRLPWCPRILTRTFAALDRLIPIGPPMDLMILARLVAKELAPVSAEALRTCIDGVRLT